MLYYEANPKLVEKSKELLKSPDDYPTYAKERTVLSAKCIAVHDNDYSLDLEGGLTIPREHVSIGFHNGQEKPAEVYTLLGKQVNFIFVEENGKLIPSRYEAQCDAVEQLDSKYPAGSILTGCVRSNQNFGSFIDIGSGVVALLPIKLQSISRTRTGIVRFPQGTVIKAVMHANEGGRYTLTTIPCLGTYEENLSRYIAENGDAVGIVRTTQSYGTFIELSHNLVGLTPEPIEEYQPGDYVRVCVTSTNAKYSKVKLYVKGYADKSEYHDVQFFGTAMNGDFLKTWAYNTVDPKSQAVFDFTNGEGFGYECEQV